ncbi:MAG: ATP-dependent DNA ligase [Hyphomicrobiaceae bacterium]|jgi:ATP-dependent DNA ligase
MTVAARKRQAGLAELGIPLDLAPMEAKLVAELPTETGWQFEPKWDGFRCLAFRAGADVEIKAKSGKSLSRFFPEVLENLRAVAPKSFVLDGELVIPVDGVLSFDALQMRLHPAQSRIVRLSNETPATFIVFDCLLRKARQSLLLEPFDARRAALEDVFDKMGKHAGLTVTPFTRDKHKAEKWLNDPQVAVDGVVAKRRDLPYRPGERVMLKVKHLRTADCVVGGFRYETARKQVGSLLLGLYDQDGLLHHVGFTSALADVDKPALTKRLEKLVAPPGFTGDAPGGPSRWSTTRSAEWQPLRPRLVVEVRYDHVTDSRFRHGTRLVRWRPDKAPAQCTFEQLPSAVPTVGLQ